MPSTVVHVAVAGLLAAALLREAYDAEAVAVIMAGTLIVDLDVFIGLVIEGTHRAAFHNVFVPVVLAALIVYDTRFRTVSAISEWRGNGPRVAWTLVIAVAVAAIGYDLVFNGVNLLYPIHDEFFTLEGELLLSDQRGVVQSFVELESQDPATAETTRTTSNTHYKTGVDPSKGAESADVEREFLVFSSGRDLLITVVGFAVAGGRLVEDHAGGRFSGRL